MSDGDDQHPRRFRAIDQAVWKATDKDPAKSRPKRATFLGKSDQAFERCLHGSDELGSEIRSLALVVPRRRDELGFSLRMEEDRDLSQARIGRSR